MSSISDMAFRLANNMGSEIQTHRSVVKRIKSRRIIWEHLLPYFDLVRYRKTFKTFTSNIDRFESGQWLTGVYVYQGRFINSGSKESMDEIIYRTLLFHSYLDSVGFPDERKKDYIKKINELMPFEGNPTKEPYNYIRIPEIFIK